jgi:hypothetical protein
MDDGGATLHVTRETREAVLRLRPAPSIVGRVEYQDGSPAADSKVAVVAVGANADVPESGTVGIWPEEEEVEAGSDGAFRFVGAPVHQSYDLEARGPSGERARAHRVVFEKGKLETEVRIRLERGAAGGVEGRVVDESGRPIEAALVAVTATGGHSGFGVFTSEEPHTVVTDALGRFHVDPVSVGTVRVVVGALGRAPRALPDVAVAAGGTTKVPDVVLRTRGLSVHGRLTDAAGRPVTGAEVWTSFSMSADGSSMSTTSGGVGPDGTWFVDGPDSEGQEVTVYFRAPGFSYTTRTLAVRGDAVLDVVMTREAALEVAVTFDGPPPATVVVERRERGSWQRLPTTWDAAARTARASQVWVGIDAIRLRADGFAPGGLQEITVPDGGTVVAKAVRLTPGGTLEGRVLDAGGRPLGGVQVSCDEWFVFVDTAEDGRFRLPHLPPGTWTFSIHAVPGREERPSPQFAAAIDEGGTTQVEWRVGP